MYLEGGTLLTDTLLAVKCVSAARAQDESGSLFRGPKNPDSLKDIWRASEKTSWLVSWQAGCNSVETSQEVFLVRAQINFLTRLLLARLGRDGLNS